jgi:hypothetical protein
MFGVVTRNEPEVDWPEFDLACYEMKDVTGRATEPVEGAVNMISAFGDNAAAEGDPDVVAVNADGVPATRDEPYFDWDYVCPTHDAYREGILEMVEDAAEANPDVRLDDVGFPRQGYCRCERCEQRFADSEFGEWKRWRAAEITDFVGEARERVPGDLYLTLYPDPYPEHLYDRSGLDLAALSPLVDEFVVPLYDTAYGTTYWLEVIASGFRDRLETPLVIELHAAEVAEAYAEQVCFGYDASNARAAVRRMRADDREGAAHGPD